MVIVYYVVDLLLGLLFWLKVDCMRLHNWTHTGLYQACLLLHATLMAVYLFLAKNAKLKHAQISLGNWNASFFILFSSGIWTLARVPIDVSTHVCTHSYCTAEVIMCFIEHTLSQCVRYETWLLSPSFFICLVASFNLLIIWTVLVHECLAVWKCIQCCSKGLCCSILFSHSNACRYALL